MAAYQLEGMEGKASGCSLDWDYQEVRGLVSSDSTAEGEHGGDFDLQP